MQKILFLCIFMFAILISNKQASAATYYSDTDGDGYTETITTNSNNITVYHPKRQRTSTYSLGTTSYAINKIVDTDGIAGNEIVVIYSFSGGSNGVYVICDRKQTYHPYSVPGQFAINSVVDTDGVAGNEIVISAANNAVSGVSYSVYVICDRKQTYHQYSIPGKIAINSVVDTDGIAGNEIVISAADNAVSGVAYSVYVICDRKQTYHRYSIPGKIAINSVVDTDGIAGNEIVISAADNAVSGVAYSVYVICDRKQTYHQYSIPGKIAINSVVDTDGIAGNEIVISAADNASYSVYVICDRKQTYHQYDAGNLGTLSIKGVKNYDGVAGNEICYSFTHNGYTGYHMIIDRMNTQNDVPGC